MKKKGLATVCLALAVTTIFSATATAVSVLSGDGFTKTSKANWEVDRYAPQEWEISNNELYLAVGPKGYRNVRPADQRDAAYSLQGKKLAVNRPTGNTWTATVKIEVPDEFSENGSSKRTAEFRVDLVDGAGNALADSPTLRLVKPISKGAHFEIYSPRSKETWSTVNTFINGDGEREDLWVDSGWHTLYIKCVDGVVSYYFDSVRLGSFSTSTRDIYPSYLALGLYNHENSYGVSFDSCYLYNGSISPPKLLSTEQQESREEKLASTYSSRREAWISKYTIDGVLTKEIPERYWDY